MQQVPSIVIQAIVPLVVSQLDQLNNLSNSLITKVGALPISTKSIKCNDPRIVEIKNTLKQINDLLASVQSLLDAINKILGTLRTIGRAAKIIQNIVTVIPTTVPGPVSSAVIVFSNTGINCISATETLQGLLSSVQTEVTRANQVLGPSLNLISSICNNEILNTTAGAQQQTKSSISVKLGNGINSLDFDRDRQGILFAVPDGNTGFLNDENGIYINEIANRGIDFNAPDYAQTALNLEDLIFDKKYISDFYTKYNVSDEDINNAIQLLNNLFLEQRSIIRKILTDRNNLSNFEKAIEQTIVRNPIGTPVERSLLLYQEPPSAVYFGKSFIDGNKSYPSLTGNTNDIFVGGEVNDFFVDTENSLIYGPKESNTVWGQPIKY